MMFDHNAYRERCSELHVSEEALQEVIEMAEQKQKKPVRRPLIRRHWKACWPPSARPALLEITGKRL